MTSWPHSNQLMQKSVIDAVAPDAPILRVDSARHAGHRRSCRVPRRGPPQSPDKPDHPSYTPLTGARIRTKQ
jgi:hypothetical protein